MYHSCKRPRYASQLKHILWYINLFVVRIVPIFFDKYCISYAVYYGTSDKENWTWYIVSKYIWEVFNGQIVGVSQGCLFICVCVNINIRWIQRPEFDGKFTVDCAQKVFCYMIFTRNVSCDSSQTDINTIEPTLSFYIKLKTAHFL